MMFGYWRKIKELEKKAKDIEERMKCVEEYMYRQDVNKVLKEYSDKYGVEITVVEMLYKGNYYLCANGKERICWLQCIEDSWAEIYREVCSSEKNIKAFMYDKQKEKNNDKEQ